MRSPTLLDILCVFAIIYVILAVDLAESEQAITPSAASPEISDSAGGLETEGETLEPADALLDVDGSTAHENKSGREARQFRTFGFGRRGFGRPAYYGGYGGFGHYGRPFYGGGFGRPYGYFPRPYYPRPYYGRPCCFYG
ncbi:uncharacterized protein LOC115065749 [Bactrocera dorsalis]|uniref:Uncharacterized protein LOC115065749 n=1 Tax=Bactrocera dorsalis TaxID=27457 RepID=A0ABM3J2I9_BACDO|nr:uncharacterized protein LOC115065749 [Bactrocera dorsalis]